MKKLILFSAVFFLPYLLIADFIQYKIDNNQINITINNLSKYVEITNGYGFDYCKINHSIYSYPKNSNGILLDNIKIKIALPDDNYELKINKIERNKLSQFTIKLDSSFSDAIKIEKIGIMRKNQIGYLIIQPFSYNHINQLSVIDNLDLTIKFNSTYPIIQNSKIEEEFFSDIINKPYLNSFLNTTDKSKSAKINSNSWYDSSKEYIKITTTKDGIAKILGNDIINHNPSLLNKEVKYLHLIHKGTEQYFSVIDNKRLIDNDLILFFEGKRAVGDTTWFDNYTDKNSFFLYYDDSFEGLRYSELPTIETAESIIETIKINEHIEYDSVYFWGDFAMQWDIENIPREKWLWKKLTNDGASKFDYYLNVVNPQNFILGLNIESIVFNKAFMTNHNFLLLVNNDTIQKLSLDTGKIAHYNIPVPSEKLCFGLNKITLVLLNQYINNDILRPNDIGLDFFEVSAGTRAVAQNGQLSFIIDHLDKDSKLDISGYKSKKIVLIDRLNNFSLQKEAKHSISIASGIKASNFPIFSLSTSDTSIYSTKNAFHIVVFNDNQMIYKTFGDNSSTIDFINTIKANDYFVFAYNASFQINTNLKNKLIELGAKKLDNIIVGNSWIMSGRKSDLNITVEDLKINSFANIEFNNTVEWGKSFNTEILLPKERNYNFISSDLESAEKAKLFKVRKTNLRVPVQADAVIITHSDFKTGANELANYRQSQGINTQVIDVEDIYKEFYYGNKSPHAIKEFLKYIYNNWESPKIKFIVLIGDGNWDARNKLKKSPNIDYIPTYGWPVSDHWYACLDSSDDVLHDVFLGRIPVTDSVQLSHIIIKLKDYDKSPKHPWMKRFLSLTGGNPINGEGENFKDNMLISLLDSWVNTEFAGDTVFIAKSADAKETEANSIISSIDKGAVWVNFLGHGSPQVFDMDGWHADKLNNYGKYSFFTTISCNTAAFAEPEGTSRDEEYFVIKDRGFIGAGGSTNLGLVLPGSVILSEMLNIMTKVGSKQRTIGEILNNAKIPILDDDKQSVAFAKQYVLLGDPMTRVRVSSEPDLFIFKDETKISNISGNNVITEKDSSIILTGWLYNNGFCERNGVELLIIHSYENELDTFRMNYDEVCLKEYFEVTDFIVYNRAGNHQISIYISTNDTFYLDYTNNFEVFKDELLPLDPFPYWNVKKSNNRFRFINPKFQEDIAYQFYISEKTDTNEITLIDSKSNEIIIKNNYLEWNPNIILDKEKNYYLYGRINDTLNSESSQLLRIPFSISGKSIDTINASINSYFLQNAKFDNLKFDNSHNEKEINFDVNKIPFSVVSARGNQEVNRFAEIIYNDLIYVQTPDVSIAPVGINLVRLSGEDGKHISTRHFYTWEGDNSTVDVIKYLRDTVQKGDWIILATCGSAWRMFYKISQIDPDAIGGFNSFKETLSDYGAEVVWQIPDTTDVLYVSYLFCGRKETDRVKPIEKIDFHGNIISYSDSLSFYPKNGSVTFPVINVSQKWIDLEIIQDNDSQVSSTISILANNPEDQIGTTKTFNNINYIDLEDQFRNLSNMRIRLDYERKNEVDDISLKSLNLRYIPLPELALNNISSQLKKDSLTRGDTVNILFEIENISQRVDAKLFDYNADINLISGSELKYSDSINFLKSDSTIRAELKFSSLKLDDINKIESVINTKYREIYSFNNKFESILHILRDRIKPTVIVKSDGNILQDSSYVSLSPLFEITLFDNSLEPITEEPFKIRINSKLQNKDNTFDYNISIINLDTLKAKLIFRPDTLTEFDNRLEVYFSDAAGNRDTVEYHIYTTINSFIVNNQVHPNPFNDNTIISFDYNAPDNSGLANLKIFDLSGKMIKSIERPLNIGENNIHWDGLDDYNNTIPNGSYFYILQIISENYSKPENGIMIKIR